MIQLENAEVVFARGEALETHALRGVDLRVEDGEFATVIGSNGAGKSTLLGAVAGDVQLAHGRVHIGAEEVTHMPAHRRAAQVARVFQDPLAGTCAHLTIEENMALAAARGTRRGLGVAVGRQRREIFRERLATLHLGLEQRLHEPVGRLSGGQRQALSLLMASLAESRVLLLDEHTAALDPRMATFVLELTQRIATEHALTVLMITHSMQSALRLGTRLVMMHQGRIAYNFSGEERQQLTIPRLLELFSQTAPDDVSDRLLLG